MIIVEGWVRLAPGEAEKFVAAALRMAEQTRREPGCLEYAFALDLADPNVMRVIERWQDDGALSAHFATPHMAAFNAALALAKIEGAEVNAYEAEFTRSLVKTP